MNANIKVEGISKTFHLSRKQMKIEVTNEPLKRAVDKLSFDAYEGEIYGLLGPNGAGKTTTLRCISTLMHPDEGKIFISGHDISTSETEVRRKIAFLTSDLKLEDFFSPNYLFEYFAKLHDMDQEKTKSRKQMLFEKFGIDRFAEVKVGELSSGMRQKVQIAISLVHDPEVIIFDEPTNGLDVITAKVVTDYLAELKKQGKTIIISTHIFSLVEKICDRVGIIINGKMVKTDLVSNIIAEGRDMESVFFDLFQKEAGEAA